MHLRTRRGAGSGGRTGRVLLVALVLVAAATACDDDLDTPPVSSAPSATAVEPETPSPRRTRSSTTDPKRALLEALKMKAELWFVAGERLSWGNRLVPSSDKTLDAVPEALLDIDNPRVLHIAVVLAELLRGPRRSDAEVATTAIPQGTELLDVELDAATATIDLSREFESGGGSLSMQLRVAQVVYTVTQFGGSIPVDAVRFAVEGEPVDALGGEGVVVEEPQTRADWLDVAPNIVVTSPRPGDIVSSPARVGGHANVFEANVNMKVMTDDAVLAETFTTATCGTGCWGEFLKRVKFVIDRPTPGEIHVLTYSAEDGSPQDLVIIPVVLVPN